MAMRYFITLPDPGAARGTEPVLAFHSVSADGFAQELQQALRTPELFERWRRLQSAPEEIDPALGATDPQAIVRGTQRDLKIDLLVTTALPGNLLKQRLRWLAGNHWELRDVKAA